MRKCVYSAFALSQQSVFAIKRKIAAGKLWSLNAQKLLISVNLTGEMQNAFGKAARRHVTSCQELFTPIILGGIVMALREDFWWKCWLVEWFSSEVLKVWKLTVVKACLRSLEKLKDFLRAFEAQKFSRAFESSKAFKEFSEVILLNEISLKIQRNPESLYIFVDCNQGCCWFSESFQKLLSCWTFILKHKVHFKQ